MRIRIVILGLLLVAAAVVFVVLRPGNRDGAETPSDALSRHSLENAAYPSDDIEGGTVRLSGGKYENPAAHVWVKMLDAVAHGDLDGGGYPEAVVILATNTGGSGVFHSMHVVGDLAGRPVHLAAVDLGDRIELESLDVEGERIVVDLVTHGPSDPMCCPTLRVIQTFELDATGLVLIEQTPAKIDRAD